MKKFLIFSLMLGFVSPLLTFAQTDQAPNTTTPPAIAVVAYDGTCASNAVIKHEDNQQTIAEIRQASIKIAANTRRNALGSAYLLSDNTARNTAIKAAYDTFLTAQKAADKTAMNASKVENDSFNTAMMGCGSKSPSPTKDQMSNKNDPNNRGQNEPNQNKNNPRILKQGMKGEDVKNIQRKLGLKIDGVFGPGTATKVKEWQAKRGLKKDGIIGNESLKKIEAEFSTNSTNSNQ